MHVLTHFASLLLAEYLIIIGSACLRFSWWIAVFFNLRIVSSSPAELSTPLGAFMELQSHANLLCLVNLALSFFL